AAHDSEARIHCIRELSDLARRVGTYSLSVANEPSRVLAVRKIHFISWLSLCERLSFPMPRIPVVHGTVPQRCARNALPARSGILYRPAIEGLRCHPLPTSSTRAPEVTPN